MKISYMLSSTLFLIYVTQDIHIIRCANSISRQPAATQQEIRKKQEIPSVEWRRSEQHTWGKKYLNDGRKFFSLSPGERKKIRNEKFSSIQFFFSFRWKSFSFLHIITIHSYISWGDLDAGGWESVEEDKKRRKNLPCMHEKRRWNGIVKFSIKFFYVLFEFFFCSFLVVLTVEVGFWRKINFFKKLCFLASFESLVHDEMTNFFSIQKNKAWHEKPGMI